MWCQSAIVCRRNRQIAEQEHKETAVETSGSTVRQTARQLDIAPTCCRRRRYGLCRSIVTLYAANYRKAKRRQRLDNASKSGSRQDRGRGSRSAASSFARCRHPRTIACAITSSTLPSPLLFPRSHDSQHTASPNICIGVSRLSRPPLDPISDRWRIFAAHRRPHLIRRPPGSWWASAPPSGQCTRTAAVQYQKVPHLHRGTSHA